MVIIMSPDYERSDECIFLTRFAQSLQPGPLFYIIVLQFII